jgi:hypothetical protein
MNTTTLQLSIHVLESINAELRSRVAATTAAPPASAVSTRLRWLANSSISPLLLIAAISLFVAMS